MSQELPGGKKIPVQFKAGQPLTEAELNKLQEELLRLILTHTHQGNAGDGKEGARLTGDAIADDAITGRHIAPGVIGKGHIGTDAVGDSELRQGEIKEHHLAPDAVTTTRIADGQVTEQKLSDEVLAQLRAPRDGASTFGYFAYMDGSVAYQNPGGTGAWYDWLFVPESNVTIKDLNIQRYNTATNEWQPAEKVSPPSVSLPTRSGVAQQLQSFFGKYKWPPITVTVGSITRSASNWVIKLNTETLVYTHETLKEHVKRFLDAGYDVRELLEHMDRLIQAELIARRAHLLLSEYGDYFYTDVYELDGTWSIVYLAEDGTEVDTSIKAFSPAAEAKAVIDEEPTDIPPRRTELVYDTDLEGLRKYLEDRNLMSSDLEEEMNRYENDPPAPSEETGERLMELFGAVGWEPGGAQVILQVASVQVTATVKWWVAFTNSTTRTLTDAEMIGVLITYDGKLQEPAAALIESIRLLGDFTGNGNEPPTEKTVTPRAGEVSKSAVTGQSGQTFPGELADRTHLRMTAEPAQIGWGINLVGDAVFYPGVPGNSAFTGNHQPVVVNPGDSLTTTHGAMVKRWLHHLGIPENKVVGLNPVPPHLITALNNPALLPVGYWSGRSHNVRSVTRMKEETAVLGFIRYFVRVRFVRPYKDASYTVTATTDAQSSNSPVTAMVLRRSPEFVDLMFAYPSGPGATVIDKPSFSLAILGELSYA